MGVLLFFIVFIMLVYSGIKKNHQDEREKENRHLEECHKELVAREKEMARKREEFEFSQKSIENYKKYGLDPDGKTSWRSRTIFYYIETDAENIELQMALKKIKNKRSPYNDGVFYYLDRDYETGAISVYASAEFGGDIQLGCLSGDSIKDCSIRWDHTIGMPKITQVDIDGGGRDAMGWNIEYEVYVGIQFGEKSMPYYWE